MSKYKVGDLVTATETNEGWGIFTGNSYSVISVDHGDDFSPIRVHSDLGEGIWLNVGQFTTTSTPTTYTRILEALAGSDNCDLARKISEALE